MVDEAHRVGDDGVTGDGPDLVVHLLGDPPIPGMPGRLAAEFEEMERFTRVHLDVVPDAVGERDRVLRDGAAVLCGDPLRQ